MSNSQSAELYQYKGKVIKVNPIKQEIYIYVAESKLLEKDGERYLPLLGENTENCKCFSVEKEDDKYLLKLTLNKNGEVKDLATALLTSKDVKAIFNENREIQDLELYG